MKKFCAFVLCLAFFVILGQSAEVMDQTQALRNYGFWFDSDDIRWQEFLPAFDNLTAVEIFISVAGSAGNVLVDIRTVGGGVLGQQTIPAASLTYTGWYKVTFPSVINLSAGTKYRIYVYADQDSTSPSNRYFWRGVTTSTYESSCDNDVSGPWPDYDYAFKTYGLYSLNRNVAYIYVTDGATATSYESFLEGKGFPTTLISQNDIVAGIFDNYGAILIGHETGNGAIWGDATKVTAIIDSNKSVLGLGEGGYAFLGKLSLSIGYPEGGHGASTDISVMNPEHEVFSAPNLVSGSPISLYSSSNTVEIYALSKPADVVLLGQSAANYYTLLEEENRYLLWGYDNSPDYMTATGKDLFENVVAYLLGTKEYVLGTWDGQGVYSRNSYTGGWTKLGTPAIEVAAGDIDRDGKDDLLGIWNTGTWVKYSTTGSWTKLGSVARDIASGDMNGDGREDLIGTWDGQGTFYQDSKTGTWVRLASPALRIAAGDIDGDGLSDLVGVWADGTWVKYSVSGAWSKLGTPADDVAAADMSGDGRDDLVGTWASQGVYYRESVSGGWVRMSSAATRVSAGDIDRDHIWDLVGIWADGTWVRLSSLGTWSKVGSSAHDVSAGRMKGGVGIAGYDEFMELTGPRGGYADGPSGVLNHKDLSSKGPGGKNFAFQEDRNPIPVETKLKLRRAGPGEPGFTFVEEKNRSRREPKARQAEKQKAR